jgi:hypothetical protein
VREWKDACIHLLPSGNAGKRIYEEYRRTLYMNSEVDNIEVAKQFGHGIKIPSYVTNNNIYAYYAKTCIKLYSQQTLIVKSLSLLKNNIENYWKSNPKLTKTDLPVFEEKAIKPHRPSSTHALYFQEELNSILPENYIDQTPTVYSCMRKELESNPPREKKKTRGMPNLSKSLPKKAPHKASKLQRSCVIELNNDKRDAALLRIQELRKQHPIKVGIIELELKKAAKFLKGYIKPVDGSEFSLDWTIGTNRYSLNFEIPHGKDPTNYKGNKLDRVLSVLETCYLIGLSEDSAEKYINEYNLHNLYRLKKYISYIFLHRTTEGD